MQTILVTQKMFQAPNAITHTDLNISVKADSRNKNAVQVLEGCWSMLLLIYEEGQGAFGQVQQDAHSGALRDAPLRSASTNTEKIAGHFETR